MTRNELLTSTVAGVIGTAALGAAPAQAAIANKGRPLKPPTRGNIQVAVAISEAATVIDFAGPWEVFQDAGVPIAGSPNDYQGFDLFHVAKTLDPIEATGGMRVLPRYTFENAPQPHVIIVGAQKGSRELHAWLRSASIKTDVTASVCTGAFQLARAGLFEGLPATTHHDFYDKFANEFPKVKLVRGLRFVENEHVSSAGGLSSGIDLALRIVERYFGGDAANQTAVYMEYHRRGQIA